ncbi:MAG: lecithin retinol acyltransferase family protein, partial [Rubripirellula sp.]
MAGGDHLFVWRRCKGIPFQHHAVDIGDGTVVHFTDGSGGVAGPGGNFADFEVCRTSFDVITRDGQDKVHRISHADALDRDEIVARAIGLVGRRGYDLLFDNCEHFAVWCVLGSEESRQVQVAVERLGAASVKALVAGAARGATRVGGRGLLRGASPWILAADAAQLATEAGSHLLGVRDATHRRRAGRAVGMATSMGLGALGGPLGVAVAGGLWVAGEVVAEASR